MAHIAIASKVINSQCRWTAPLTVYDLFKAVSAQSGYIYIYHCSFLAQSVYICIIYIYILALSCGLIYIYI